DKARGIGYTEEGTPPLRAGASGTNQVPTIVFPINTQMALRGEKTSNTSREGIGLGAGGDPSFTLQAAHCHAVAFAQNPLGKHRTGYITRRLTPVECERLQGFPDN